MYTSCDKKDESVFFQNVDANEITQVSKNTSYGFINANLKIIEKSDVIAFDFEDLGRPPVDSYCSYFIMLNFVFYGKDTLDYKTVQFQIGGEGGQGTIPLKPWHLLHETPIVKKPDFKLVRTDIFSVGYLSDCINNSAMSSNIYYTLDYDMLFEDFNITFPCTEITNDYTYCEGGKELYRMSFINITKNRNNEMFVYRNL